MKAKHYKILYFITLSAVCGLILSGCSTIIIKAHIAGGKPPICGNITAGQKVLVLWGTAWRHEQKAKDRREQIASGAIKSFFDTRSSSCPATVLRSLDDKDPVSMSDAEILRSSSVVSGQFRKVIVIRIEELGPTLAFYLSPFLWQGSTNVCLRIKVLDVAGSSLDTDVALQWEKGGAFVLRGTKYLEESLVSALTSVFQ